MITRIIGALTRRQTRTAESEDAGRPDNNIWTEDQLAGFLKAINHERFERLTRRSGVRRA